MHFITTPIQLFYQKSNIVIVKLTRQTIRIKIREETISMIYFTDDIVIITESERDVQRAINEMEGILRTFKMKINLCKETTKHSS